MGAGLEEVSPEGSPVGRLAGARYKVMVVWGRAEQCCRERDRWGGRRYIQALVENEHPLSILL